MGNEQIEFGIESEWGTNKMNLEQSLNGERRNLQIQFVRSPFIFFLFQIQFIYSKKIGFCYFNECFRKFTLSLYALQNRLTLTNK
jgi:hypothetical protein